MKNKRFLLIFVMLAMATGLTLGCNSGPSEEELAMAQLQEQLGVVNQTYEQLQTVRGEITVVAATMAEIEAISEKKRSDEQIAQLDELAAKIPDLENQAETAFGDLQGQLAEVLTVGLNDFPQSPETTEALIIYSDEAMIVADEIVAKSGDYKKAIEHLGSPKGYYSAVELPIYPALEAKIDELDDWSFITQERFDAVTKGMTMDEVKATVGVPYYANIQEDEQRGIQTWLYKKREGGAAAIYIKVKTGKVYSTNWDVIKTKVVTE